MKCTQSSLKTTKSTRTILKSEKAIQVPWLKRGILFSILKSPKISLKKKMTFWNLLVHSISSLCQNRKLSSRIQSRNSSYLKVMSKLKARGLRSLRLEKSWKVNKKNSKTRSIKTRTMYFRWFSPHSWNLKVRFWNFNIFRCYLKELIWWSN